jgi:CO/xanthine dehydrogenase Mo-binding subunit
MPRSVGRQVPRRDGPAKVTGAARYVDDLALPGMLYGATVRAGVACGVVEAVHLDFDPAGFTIVTPRDIPGRNVVALLDSDQPALAEREVRHHGEPLLLLAHPDRDRLREAVARVRVDCRPGTPVLDPGASPRTFKTIAIERGRPGRAGARAHLTLEGEYRTGAQEHLYVEPQGMLAVPEGDGVAVHGSLQCPYFVHAALVVLLGLPGSRVRVVQAETGGGFGGKEDYPSVVAGHAALLALKARRPVKLVYDRVEDLLATTKRHPAVIRHRTAVARDGRLLAAEVEVLLDGGAYATLSPVVLSRAMIHALGPYRCDHVRLRGRAVMTNTPPAGAFRGFGAPQVQFAAEVHLDRIAEALGLDPVRIREVNALRPGDRTVTGQRLDRDAGALAVLREAVRRTGFRRRRRALRGTARGLGLALVFHGAGFTGGGEARLASRASVALTPRGARILAGSTEIGQGTRTVHAQIVADALGIPYERVEVAAADTALVPDSGPTVASRTCMVVGRLLEECARDLRRALGRLTPREYLRRHGPLVATRAYAPPPGPAWDEARHRGPAYAAYGWACDVADVERDPDTGEVRVHALTAVHEAGRAIHPGLARGQIEGGTVQGLGWALLERVVLRDGRLASARLRDYAIPTTLDTPPLDVAILERPYAGGPSGAKGLGELPIDGVAPAVVNALRATGADLRELPATPERILEALCASR